MNIRKELGALRDKYRSLACQNQQVVQDVDALLQRIPDDWELRPREANERMIDAHYCEHLRNVSDRTIAPREKVARIWRAMWDEAGENDA